MATRYLGIPATSQIQAGRLTIVGAASGGTLTGSQSVQLVFDDAVFTSSLEGKQRLLNAIKAIENDIQVARSWPIDTTS